jgi:hypothetical protein
LAGRRITLLRRRLKEVSRHRATRRKERERSEIPTVFSRRSTPPHALSRRTAAAT